MRLGALLFLLYACAADDVEVYDEEPINEEEPEVVDESIRRSVDALLRFPLQRDEIKHRITVSDGDRDTGFLELSGREEVADAAYAFGLIKGAPRRGTRQLQGIGRSTESPLFCSCATGSDNTAGWMTPRRRRAHALHLRAVIFCSKKNPHLVRFASRGTSRAPKLHALACLIPCRCTPPHLFVSPLLL